MYMQLKQLETTQKVIGDNRFYIRPFPAFVAANISGELASLAAPFLSCLAPMVGDDADMDSVMDMDVEKLLPSISTAFSSISGDKFEALMKKLLIDNGNISVEGPVTEGQTLKLDYNVANEVFCGDVQDMYILCFEVIRLNFKGFFKRIGARFGNLRGLLQSKTPTQTSTESSTELNSQNSN